MTAGIVWATQRNVLSIVESMAHQRIHLAHIAAHRSSQSKPDGLFRLSCPWHQEDRVRKARRRPATCCKRKVGRPMKHCSTCLKSQYKSGRRACSPTAVLRFVGRWQHSQVHQTVPDVLLHHQQIVHCHCNESVRASVCVSAMAIQLLVSSG